MTVGESIISWLYGFGNIETTELIDTDRLDGEAGSYGLYKQPSTEITSFVDGSRDVTEYYYLLARQSAKANSSRINNHAWMEELGAWVREQNATGNLPTLDGRRCCYGVDVTVGAYMSGAKEHGTAEYQISVSINYTEV